MPLTWRTTTLSKGHSTERSVLVRASLHLHCLPMLLQQQSLTRSKACCKPLVAQRGTVA